MLTLPEYPVVTHAKICKMLLPLRPLLLQSHVVMISYR